MDTCARRFNKVDLSCSAVVVYLQAEAKVRRAGEGTIHMQVEFACGTIVNLIGPCFTQELFCAVLLPRSCCTQYSSNAVHLMSDKVEGKTNYSVNTAVEKTT